MQPLSTTPQCMENNPVFYGSMLKAQTFSICPPFSQDFPNLQQPCHLLWLGIHQTSPQGPPIFNGKSVPDNNPGWKKEFAYLEWEGGDWGPLFRKTFSKVTDGNAKGISLSTEDQAAFDTLTQGDGMSITCQSLINEESLRAVGLSPVSEGGNFLSCLCFSYFHT